MDFNTLRYNLQQPYLRSNWQEWLQFIFGQQVSIDTKAEKILIQKGNAKIIERFASIALSDKRNIAVLDIVTTKDVQIARNRVALRDIVFNLIDQDKYHGLLVFYFSEDKKQADYRFSFISSQTEFDADGNLIKQSTHPKRFSFILGSNETCTTATKRLLELKNKVPKFKAFENQKGITLKDVTDTFSVEALNNEFFKKYKDIHYKRFSEYITNKDDYAKLLLNKDEQDISKQQKPIRDFVKKMLGRIVFLHFLQKKGWLACPSTKDDWTGGDKSFMQNLFTFFPKKEQFYSKCLTILFYEILNTKRDEDLIPKTVAYKPDNQKNISSTTFRIPFLNGGLFDDDQPKTNNFNFPVEYFKDLFDFFEQYNFTIDENSPEEQEVGIDPEMLGHIFENLLEENKDKGAYYTPKEIVHYMCQESLIQYLTTHLPECAETDSPATKAIELFIRKDDIGDRHDKKNFIVINAKRIEAILDKVKICDPAIGSGAFPMGMLQEIFKAKTTLDLTLDKAQVKKDIIQNSIYGVDIEKGAVDIARLRFWLALVVDETVPHPLPNLDYKIMQGNTLLESFEEVDLSTLLKADDEEDIIYAQQEQIQMFAKEKQTLMVFDKTTKEELQSLINLYFDFDPLQIEILHNPLIKKIIGTNKLATKQQVKQAINAIVEGKLKAHFFKEKLKYESEKAHQNKLLDSNKIYANDPKGIVDKKQKSIDKLNKEIESLTQKINHLAEILEKLNQWEKDDKERPYFLWHTYFKDVFDTGGFDIVIANPPYLKERDNAHIFKQVNESAFGKLWHTGKMDYWFYFLHKAIDVSNKNSVITFITSRYWLNSLGAKKLINRVQAELSFTNFVDIGKLKVFDNVAGHHMIAIYSKAKQLSFTYKKIQNEIAEIISTESSNNLKIKTLYNDKVFNSNNEIIIEDDTINYKKDLILGDIYDVAQGIVEAPDRISTKNLKENPNPNINVGDGVFVLTEAELNKLKLNKTELSVLAPYLDPSQIGKYFITNNNKKFIIYSDRDTKEKIANNPNFSNLKKHLDKYQDYISSSNKPYGLHRPRNSDYFIKEKIIFKNMFVSPEFTIDTEGFYLGFSFSSILQKSKDFTLKYLLAILNSKFASFWFYQNGKMRGAGVDIGVEKLRLFPISPCEQKEKFETLTEYLIYLNDNSKEQVVKHTENARLASHIEDVLNMMVYELYFESHMKETGIDVLQFIHPKSFTELDKDKDIAATILSFYYWLQTPDNPVRQRINVVDIKSPGIISHINASSI